MPPFSTVPVLLSDDDSCLSFGTMESTIDVHKPLHEQYPYEGSITRKSVRFSDFDNVIETIHINDMEDHEVDAAWFSYEEMRAIKMECINLVGMLEDAALIEMLKEDNDEFSLRGLRERSGEIKLRKKEAVRQLYIDVLEVQAFSNFQGVSNVELIAEASYKNSFLECQEALALGRSDATIAAIL